MENEFIGRGTSDWFAQQSYIESNSPHLQCVIFFFFFESWSLHFSQKQPPKCCSSSCRGEQTVQGFFSQISEFFINTNVWVFFVLPNALKTFDLLMHSAFIRNSTHALHVPGTGNAPEEWRWTCVNSSSGSRERIHPDTVQLGLSLRSIVGWLWSNALINRWIVRVCFSPSACFL